MAFSSSSFFAADTNNTTRNYAKAADHTSYKIYNNMTWSMWVACGPGTNKNLWSLWDTVSGAKRSWLFSNQVDGKFRIILSWDGTNFSLHKTANPIFDYSWKNIVVTFASGVFACYINDVTQTLDQTIAWGGGAVALNSGGVPHMIGSEESTAPVADKTFGGCFSNFSIWNKVLSAAERTALYNGGRPGDLTAHSAFANCVTWIRADQSDTAPTLVDSITSSANMTIVKSGANPFFGASTQHATVSTDPGITNVRFGTTYITDGDAKTGSLVSSSGAHIGPRQGIGA